MAIPSGVTPVYLSGSGRIDLTRGRFGWESGAYVYGVSQQTNWFTAGSTRIYALNPIVTFGRGKATAVLGQMGTASLDFRVRPWGAFKDFCIFRVNDPILNGIVLRDDAGPSNNPNPQGTSSARTGNEGATMTAQPWTRHSRVVIPPRRSAYAVPQPVLYQLPQNKNVYFDGHQLEVAPTYNANPTPLVPSRGLNVFPRAYQINYCENPNGTLNLKYWSGTGIAQINGSNGNSISVPSSATVTIPLTVVGGTYTVAAVVWNNTASVTISIGSTNLTTISSPVSGNGGLSLIYATYTPTSPSTSITFTSTSSFVINNVIVGAGSNPVPYFDGNSGNDFMWELNGTPDNCRSYWYPGRLKRHGNLVKNLKDNMPFGMTLNKVIYATLPKPDGNTHYGQGYYGWGVYE